MSPADELTELAARVREELGAKDAPCAETPQRAADCAVRLVRAVVAARCQQPSDGLP